MNKLIITGLLIFSFLGTQAQNYQLHSVFIYSFARYIQWPDDANGGDFTISVLGDSPIVGELNNLASKKKVGERTIKVSRINTVGELQKCNILFVPTDRAAQLTDVLAKLGDASTLIVTETPGLGAKGSNINFIQRDGKLAFELNSGAFTRRRLKPSTELTRMAILI